MARRIDDARKWRARAEEARSLAEQLVTPEARRIMLGIAVSYVALAQMAEECDAARDKRKGSALCLAAPSTSIRCLAQNTATARALSPVGDIGSVIAASPSTIVASAILAVSVATGSLLIFVAILLQASSNAVKITFSSAGPKEVARTI